MRPSAAQHAARGDRRARARRVVALCAVVIAAAGSADAGPLTDFSQAELLTLPRICLAQRFINQELAQPAVPEAERARLAEQLGHSYIHFHHYCWALLYLARAARPDGDKFNNHRAVDNLDYVIRHAAASFALLPQVYVLKGDGFARTGRGDAAAIEYRNAIQADPSYAPAYVALALQLLAAGDVGAAQAVLTDARRHDPSTQPQATPVGHRGTPAASANPTPASEKANPPR
jgi:hypothetical protein